MKTISLALALILTSLVSVSLATPVTKIGFMSYSGDANVECGVFGMSEKLKTDASGTTNGHIQGFSPDPTYSRTLSLGAGGGYKNYSTSYSSKRNLTAVQWTCRTINTNSEVKVKVFLNDVQMHFLTLDNGVFVIGY